MAWSVETGAPGASSSPCSYRSGVTVTVIGRVFSSFGFSGSPSRIDSSGATSNVVRLVCAQASPAYVS